MPLATEKLHL